MFGFLSIKIDSKKMFSVFFLFSHKRMKRVDREKRKKRERETKERITEKMCTSSPFEGDSIEIQRKTRERERENRLEINRNLLAIKTKMRDATLSFYYNRLLFVLLSSAKRKH